MADKFNFTIQKLQAVECPAGKDRVYVYDTKRVGLCLCAFASGGKTFYLYRKLDGRPERIKLGAFPPMTIDQARDATDTKNGEIAAGKNPAEDRRRARGENTLEETFNRYIDEYAKVHKRTWKDDQDQFDRYCGGIKSRKLSQIKRRDIQALHAKIGDKAKYAANRLLALLSKVYSVAADFGYEGMNPCLGIKRFREESRTRFVDADELPRLLAAIDAHEDKDMADFFLVCLYTGARRSNVQAMKWADINFGRRAWAIPANEAKAGDALEVYLSELAMDLLRRRWELRKGGAVYVFPSRGKTGHIVEPKGAWKEILAAAEIKDLRIHDLRRTLGSWMAAGGASLPVIGKTLGHRSQQSTQIYSRLNLNPVANAVEMTQASMAAAVAEAKAKAEAEAKKKGGIDAQTKTA